MENHAVVAAASGLLLLAVFILTVGDAARALPVWLAGAAAGGTASLILAHSPRLRRAIAQLRKA